MLPRLTYGSVCSGIEAATCAWHPLGWTPSFFSEIDKFPRAVLAHRYPVVPLHGDFTTIREGEYDPIDLLVGGTPCQSFSVAGLRGGMADARGNLALQYLALAARLRPRWLVWENVPGVLSSNGGRDFGSFLGGLVELGYGFAYRILDAQYFNLAQRRARVFVVGYLGDWRRAAAVLLERESLSGNPAPRREKGERPAPTIASRPTGGGGLGTDFDCDGGLIAHAIQAGATRENPDGGPDGVDVQSHIAYTIEARAEVQAVAFNITPSNSNKDFNAREADYAQAVTAGGNRPSARGGDLIAFNGHMDPVHGDVPGAIDTNAQTQCIAFSAKDHGADAGEIAPTLRAGGHDKSHANAGVMPAVAFTQNQCGDVLTGDIAAAMGTNQNATDRNTPKVSQAMSVRRLTPTECEKLQGFEPGYTAIPYRGKPAADGPRYKALGNSMAVPCMAWIGQRIQAVESHCLIADRQEKS